MMYDIIGAYALAISPNQAYEAFSSDAWATAILVAVQGMATIFLVLASMWGILGIFKLVFAKKEKKVDEPVAVKQEPVEIKTEEPVATATDDAQLIAVITAAVAAYRASEGESDQTGSFRVVSFKRASANRSWNSNK